MGDLIHLDIAIMITEPVADRTHASLLGFGHKYNYCQSEVANREQSNM